MAHSITVHKSQKTKPAKFAARRALLKMLGYPVNFHSPAKEMHNSESAL